MMEIKIKEKNKQIADEVREKYKKYYNPSLLRLLKFSGYDTVEVKGEGVYIYDINGRRFLDCAGGYGVFSLGHSHPKVIQAVKEQLDKMALSAKVFLNKPLADLCEKLAQITPGDLQYSFICNSGAEAVEGAIKLARYSTGKKEIITAKGAFHGKTLGSLSASGRELYKEPFRPLLPEFIQVNFNDIEDLKNNISEETAAVLLEPVQGEGGIITPDDDYLKQVRELCDENNTLLITDEIQTGLGRTGRMFAVDHYGVCPDIMLTAKALGGGVMPIGAFTGTEKVWECFKKSPLIHTSTFGGNPLACAAALAAINVIEEENLVDNSAKMGEYLTSELGKIKEKYPEIVSEIRGKGLLAGVEMTKEGYAGSIIFEMAKNNVIGAYTLNLPKVIRFEPPLIINKEQVDECVKAFEAGVKKTKEMFIK
ncbi:MAG: aspartate aminotransferase family protein [Armatimonadota bacterium]